MKTIENAFKKDHNKIDIVKIAVLILIVLMLGSFSRADASPAYVIAGYAPGYDSNPSYGFASGAKYATDIPWGSLSHVYFAFATVGGTNVHMDDPNAIAAGLCANAHSHGVRCYISVGGAQGNSWPTDTTNDSTCSTLAQNIANLLTATAGVTFDGIDIDWEVENASAPAQSAFFAGLISNLRTDLNAKTPGMAKTGKYSGESNVGLSMYLEAGYYVCDYSDLKGVLSDLDWCTQSGYDININVGGDIFQGALSDTTYSFTNCVSSGVQASISAVANYFGSYTDMQIPYSKMILGMPLYARDAAGAATSPAALVGTGTFGTYDTTRCECPTTYSGTSYGADTGQSYCDKINWALGKGYQGIGMWDLGQGLPTTANSMVTSIWNVLNGSNSCVTVTSGCGAVSCTPTFTPTSTPSCGTLIDNFESGLTENDLKGQWSDYVPTGTTASMVNTINDGLNGSVYGMRLSGATTVSNTATFNTGLNIAPGTYNASGGQTGITFWVRVDKWSGTSQPATILVELQTAGSSGAEYATTVIVPAANVGNGTFQSGIPYLCTVYFSNFVYQTWSDGGLGATTMSLTNLYLLTFAAEPSVAVFNYDMTLDDIYFGCPPTPTPTPTWTFTNSPTKTPSPTMTMSSTMSNTATNTSAFTSTNTSTPSSTHTMTDTPGNTSTSTSTATSTSTMANTATYTSSATATNTVANTATRTSTSTSTSTNTAGDTETQTNTSTPLASTATMTASSTKTSTMASTSTSTASSTATNTVTNTPNAPTNTQTNTGTPTSVSTNTSTSTSTALAMTATSTSTSSVTSTHTSTATSTNTVPPNTSTSTQTVTHTETQTSTVTPTMTTTPMNTATSTLTPSDTTTMTSTPTMTNTNTLTSTITPKYTSTRTSTATMTFTGTNTPTITGTPTNTPSFTPTAINKVLVSPPFPNPVSFGPVEINVTTPGQASILMDVYTIAFRKVVEHSFTAGPANGVYGTVTSVQWDLKDRMGMMVANGLYYVRIRVIGGGGATNIQKVLVIR